MAARYVPSEELGKLIQEILDSDVDDLGEIEDRIHEDAAKTAEGELTPKADAHLSELVFAKAAPAVRQNNVSVNEALTLIVGLLASVMILSGEKED